MANSTPLYNFHFSLLMLSHRNEKAPIFCLLLLPLRRVETVSKGYNITSANKQKKLEAKLVKPIGFSLIFLLSPYRVIIKYKLKLSS